MAFLSSRKVGALLLTLAALVVEVVFAWLSSRAYAALLFTDGDGWESESLQWLVFLLLTVFGFILATHRQYGVAARYEQGRAGVNVVIAVAVLLAHDWGAAIYTVLRAGHQATPELALVVVGLWTLALLPFLTAQMLLALAA